MNLQLKVKSLNQLIVSFVFPDGPGRGLFLGESEVNAGHFSPRRQPKIRELLLSCQKKGKFETLKVTYRLEKSLFQTGK